MPIDLSIVLPLYNEEENIQRIPKELIPELEKLGLAWEIIAVNDGSRDRTEELLRDIQNKETRLKIYSHAKNQGLGAGVRTGIQNSSGTWIITLDGDFTFHPKLIPLLIQKQKETSADCVIGSPFMQKKGLVDIPAHRVLLTRASNLIYRLVLNLPVTSVTAIFRLYRGDLVRKMDLVSEGFPINAEILTKLSSLTSKFSEVAAPLTVREFGKSKANLIQETFRHLKLIFHLWRRKKTYQKSLSALAIFILVFAVFSPTLFYQFLNWDDNQLLTQHPWYSPLTWTSFLQMWDPRSLWRGIALDYSPVRDTSYAIDYLLWGWNPFGYHLTQVLLHSLNASLLFYFFTNYFSIPVSLLGASFWAFHPLVVEPVAWISSRKDLLMMFWILISLQLFQRGNQVTGAISAIFAIFSKYTSMILGPLIYVYERKKNQIPLAGLTLFGLLFSLFVFKSNQHLGGLVQTESISQVHSYWPSIFQIFSHYFEKIFWPVHLSARYSQHPEWKIHQPAVQLGLLLFLIWIGLIIWSFKIKNSIFYPLAWISISMIPNLLQILSGHPIWVADRYIYLPLVGFIFLFLEVVKKIQWKFLLVLLPVLVFGSVERMQVWKNSLEIWQDTTSKNPNLYYVWGNLGEAQREAGHFESAIGSYQKEMALKPDWSEGWIKLAHSYAGLKNFKEAQKNLIEYEKKIASKNSNGLLKERGLLWAQLGKRSLAEKLFNEYIQDHSWDSEAWSNVGTLHAVEGDLKKALENWNHAIELNPSQSSARMNLARHWFSKHQCDLMKKQFSFVRNEPIAVQAEIEKMIEKCK